MDDEEEMDPIDDGAEQPQMESDDRRERVLEAVTRREATSGGGVSAAKAMELKDRRVKDELVGRLTEHYHRRREEAPLGLGAASAAQLKRLWERAQEAEAGSSAPSLSSSSSSSAPPPPLPVGGGANGSGNNGRGFLGIACGALAEGDEDTRDKAKSSDLQALGHLLGAKCVDATQVEHSVIDRCDTSLELRRKSADLQNALREESKWERSRRQLLARKKAEEALGHGDEVEQEGAEQDATEIEERLAEAREKRRCLESEVQQLQSRSKALQSRELCSVASTASSPSGFSSGPSRSFTHLRSEGSFAAPLDLDELDSDDHDSGDDDLSTAVSGDRGSLVSASAPVSTQARAAPAPPPQAAASIAVRTAAATVSPQKAAHSAPVKEGKPSGVAAADAGRGSKGGTTSATLSAKEYLQRFQQRKAAVAAEAVATGRAVTPVPASLSAGAGSSQPSPSSQGQSQSQSYRPLPVAGDGSQGARAEKRPPTRELKKPKAEAGRPSPTPSKGALALRPEADADSKKYRIDVNQLVPKPAVQDMNKWRQAHPTEYMAMRAMGETEVSAHQNLMKAKPFVAKRKQEHADDAAPKVRRGDDSSDVAFQRRQANWTLGRGVAAESRALSAKQQVDEDGNVMIKRQAKTEQDDGDKERKVKGKFMGLQDDVQVSDGLRAPRWLWEALYPYQHTCVRWLWDLHRERHGGILADEMGLGKTVQIAAYLGALYHSGVLQSMRVQNTSQGAASPANTGGVLIVCPATLISQWRNELHIWYPPLRVCIMHQVGEAERRESIRVACREHGVLITSYETMRRAQDELLEATWVIVVLDEGQKIRSPDAGVTIAAKQFSTPHRIILSGSPIQNNLRELWSLFDFIYPGLLGTLPVFEEEMAQPIEAGNLMGANETTLAGAYQCALALRELTQPCILRRTKAECMDVLKLPHKQEQVLFCNLTPEQYQVYIEFLQTDQVRRSMTISGGEDKRKLGAAFFSISVLRKLCNHPDLLLKDADPSMQPEDMWNPQRSGKMKVLVEIMKKWKAEGHRALVFVQTVMMLDVLQRWMETEGHTHLRIDGKTAVKRRLTMIEEFNGNVDIFCMILTTRVGGVGLNIVGANRVVIFDPDWNPMTDVQARERTWRIGQRRDVTIYRLVCTGTVEEKIYQRQVYKHFLSQKILNDPRQRQFFKWNDLADLFDIPPTPPDFSPKDMMMLKQKYKTLFRKLRPDDEDVVETTEVMKAVTDLPTKEQHKGTKESKAEHSSLLQTLYDSNGIKASFNHDKVEQPLLDRRIVREGANLIASRAVQALQRSALERAGHHISEPTWTGSSGRAGAPGRLKKEPKKERVKLEPGTTLALRNGAGASAAFAARGSAGGGATPLRQLCHRSGASSAHILDGLRTLAAIRSAATLKMGPSQSAEAARLGVVKGGRDQGAKREPGVAQLALTDGAAGDADPEHRGASAVRPGHPAELHASDREIGEAILSTFLDPKLAGRTYSLTTGQVLEHLSGDIAPHHSDLFKSLLKQMCELQRPSHPSQPGVWLLREEFRPTSGRAA